MAWDCGMVRLVLKPVVSESRARPRNIRRGRQLQQCQHSLVSIKHQDRVSNLRGAAFLVKTGVADMVWRGRDGDLTLNCDARLETDRRKSGRVRLTAVGSIGNKRKETIHSVSTARFWDLHRPSFSVLRTTVRRG
jgi:hypothetical protein